MYLIGALVVSCILALTSAKSWNNLEHGKTVACPVWTQTVLESDNNLFKYDNNETDWTLCTHLIVLDDEFLQRPNGVSEEKRNADHKQIIDLRTNYPHLQISLTVSPINILKKYMANIDNASAIVELYTQFADSIKSRGFDGVDINFNDLKESFINIRRISKNREVFPEILKGIKYTLNERNLFMTSSFSATFEFTSYLLNITQYVDKFDYFHIYQLSIDNSPKITFGQAENEMNRFDLEKKINNIMEWGIPRSKIIIGVTFGGPLGQAPFDANIMDAKAQPIVGYNKICEKIAKNETHTKSINETTQLVTFGYKFEPTKQNFAILYATTQAIAVLMMFTVENNFTGVMAYNIANDDFAGDCELDEEDDTWKDFYIGCGAYESVPERVDNKFPFIRTVNEALYKAVKGAKGGASSFKHSSIYVALVLLGVLLSSVLSI